MWLKAFGSILVIITGTYIGFRMANRCKERPKQISHLLSCLAALKSYINYVAMPLPEALEKAASGLRGPVPDMILYTAEVLKEKGWMTPKEAIEESMSLYRDRLAFDIPEKEILSVLGANLGLVNREEQYKYIGVIEAQLLKIEYEATRYREQNAKMYQYLGVCGSLAVVILLI